MFDNVVVIDLDTADRAIVNQLQAEGRMTNSELADRVNLSPSACLRRVRRLEEVGVIDGYVMLVNARAIGRGTDVFVEISLTTQQEDQLEEFESAVGECPEVMSCHLMAGGFDYLLHVVAADVADYERVHKTHLARLPGVDRIRSSFALRTVCKKTAHELP